MPIDTAPLRIACLACGLLLAGAAAAQVPVDALTEVRAIRFEGAHAISKHRLQSVVMTRDRGASYAVRVAAGWLPFVPPPAHQPFSPLTLQEDVARLRQLYVAEGFLHADVR